MRPKQHRTFKVIDFDRMTSREHRKSYPWVKLWLDLVDDQKFKQCSNEAQLLFIKIVILAARTSNNVTISRTELCALVRRSRYRYVHQLMNELLENQLVSEITDASSTRHERDLNASSTRPERALQDKIRKDSSRVDSITPRDPNYKHPTANEQIKKVRDMGLLEKLPDRSSRNLDESIEANHKVRENRSLERLGRL
jgi:hypothetical protein